MTLLILAIAISLFYLSNRLSKHQKLITIIIKEIPVFYGYLDEYKRLAANGCADECNIDSKTYVATEVTKLVELLGYAVSGKTQEFITVLTNMYGDSPAEFKKHTTQVFQEFLEKYSALSDNKIYELAYIFNRFLTDFIASPKKAALFLLYRFYKFLRSFGYL
jgi:hypothetical protein